MSGKLTGYIFDLTLPPTAKLVALAYADHADHDGGNIYPSVPTIARKTGLSDRAVTKTTRWLENIGLFMADGESPLRTNRWRINMHWEMVNLVHHGEPDSPNPLITIVNNTESINTVVISNLGEPDSPVNDVQPILDVMAEFGIMANTKTLELAGRDYMTPEYIRALGQDLKKRKNGEYQPGLLVTILDSGVEAPELNKRGHLMDCKCDECDRARYVEGEFAWAINNIEH